MPPRASTLKLNFESAEGEDLVRGQLSAVVQTGEHLWIASDESNSVERLSRREGGEYAQHKTFALSEYVDLPAGDEEIDIEGMDYDGGYLWITGSHSLKRRKPKGSDPEKGAQRLAELRADGNRYLIARIPLHEIDRTDWVPARSCRDTQGDRTSARLMGSDRGNVLTEVLRVDEHLAPFLAIPGKDNGLDVEGIAVHGNRVFLGLRGPVLRGWAVVLELWLEEAGPGLLGLGPVKGSDRPYRKHFLDLRGLGVRDLQFHKSDLLILAGPTMDVDGPAAVYRWKKPLDAEAGVLLDRDELDQVLELPYGIGEEGAYDHPEGMTVFAEAGEKPKQLLVVYDSPHSGRIEGEGGVQADLFAFGG
ncbi:MAG: DUF3616 domain-containing protein [Gemmatimonadetes bacterium]|nr:DUF3616 domain-containing protein [Gemmatimonadota bacterium]